MEAVAPPTGSLRVRQKAQTRELIVDALVAALASGELDKVSHDALAKRTAVSRQTVYRHFPDREALMSALWQRLNATFAAAGMPTSERTLLEGLAPTFAAFDRHAELVTIAQSTPQGHAMRQTGKARRIAAFRQATASATAGLPEEDAVLATAIVQLLVGGPAWMEMRQQWGLTGEQMARACGWALRTLLADLHSRKGRPLESP